MNKKRKKNSNFSKNSKKKKSKFNQKTHQIIKPTIPALILYQKITFIKNSLHVK